MEIEIKKIDKGGWISLVIGLILAIIAFQYPFVKYMISFFITLVHELGHAMVAWLFGAPAVPSFDFKNVGGVTHTFQQNRYFLYFVYFMFFIAITKLYRNMGATILLIGLIILHIIVNLNPPAFEIFGLFMGEGTTTVFAAIFLYRAISNDAVITPLERPLYAFLAFYTFAQCFIFSYKLLYDATFQEFYFNGKPGVPNDFLRIAGHINSATVDDVTIFYAFFTIAFFVLTFVFYRYKNHIYTILGGE